MSRKGRKTMPNPLFDSLSGQGSANPCPNQKDAPIAPNAPQMTMQDAMARLRQNPGQMIRQAGFEVPDEIAGNPQAAVMHLVQTGQVGGGRLQQIMRMMGMR